MPFVDDLIKQGWLQTPEIIKAFRKVKREDFLQEGQKKFAFLDQPLPIGGGQTNSQPLTVAFMLEKLQPEPGDKILDIGSGSGWTTALLAEISGQKGRVVSMEVIPELKEFGQKNVSEYGFSNVEYVCENARQGYPQEAPYDKILCSASIRGKIPQAWKDQLKNNGRMVLPVDSSIWLVSRNEQGFRETEYPGFSFVPLI